MRACLLSLLLTACVAAGGATSAPGAGGTNGIAGAAGSAAVPGGSGGVPGSGGRCAGNCAGGATASGGTDARVAGDAAAEAAPPPCTSGICQPGPPKTGPGSISYAHARVRITAYGHAGPEYWLYEPSVPAPANAPVVIYLHGYGSTEPTLYDAMLRHLARKGYLVVFPNFGTVLDVANYEQNARAAAAAALSELTGASPHVRPNGAYAFAGYSVGAMLALRLAATTDVQPALPAPNVLVLHDTAGKVYFPMDLSAAALGRIAPSTRLLVIESEQGLADANSATRDAFANTTSIPRAQKNYLLVRSDDHGTPPIVSDHLGVLSGTDGVTSGALDAVDYWGYFRPTEGALAESLGVGSFPGYSAFCNDAVPACEAVRDTGEWSDGRKVTPLENAADLGY